MDYTIYAIDDRTEPEQDVDEAEAEETPEDDDDDADYVPRALPVAKRRRRIGTVRLDAGGKLSIVAVDPAERDDVASAVAHMNERETLFIKGRPEGEGDEDDRFAISKVPVRRGEPRFLEALQDNLQRFHGMELEAEGG